MASWAAPVPPSTPVLSADHQVGQTGKTVHPKVAGHTENIKLTGGAGGFTANSGSHGVSVDPGTVRLTQLVQTLEEPVLQAGDQVLLLDG